MRRDFDDFMDWAEDHLGFDFDHEADERYSEYMRQQDEDEERRMAETPIFYELCAHYMITPVPS